MGHGTVDALLLSLAHDHGMVLTTALMKRAGVPWHQVRSREGSLLTRVGRGVYIVGRPTPDRLLRAAVLAVPGAVVARRSAARAHGLPVAAGPEAEVLAPGPTRLQVAGVQVNRTLWLPGADVAVSDGMPTTTVPRTLCDLAAVVSRGRLRHLVESAIVARQTTTTELLACAAGWCRQGRQGSGAVRLLEPLLSDDEPIPASELERRAVRLLNASELTGWVLHHPPPWYDGVRGVVDLAWPDHQLVVELDGRSWHTITQAMVEDRRRDRLATSHGWATFRFTWSEVVERPGQVIDDIRELLAIRLPVAGRRRGRGTRSDNGHRPEKVS